MIDWARVAEVQAEIGNDDLDEVIDLFLEEAADTVAGLEAGLDGSGAPDRAAQALHFLKGGALNLGFAELAHACTAGEFAIARGQPPDAAMLAKVFAASRDALLQGLAARRAA